MKPILLHNVGRLGMNFTNPLGEHRDRVSENLVIPSCDEHFTRHFCNVVEPPFRRVHLIQVDMSRFRGMVNHETGEMQDDRNTSPVSLAVDDGLSYLRRDADPRRGEKDVTKG